jgi:hypothetical protein
MRAPAPSVCGDGIEGTSYKHSGLANVTGSWSLAPVVGSDTPCSRQPKQHTSMTEPSAGTSPPLCLSERPMLHVTTIPRVTERGDWRTMFAKSPARAFPSGVGD